MQSLVIFALGLSVGSFLNVLIYRLPLRSGLGSLKKPDLKKRFDLESLKRSGLGNLGSVIWGRSQCPNCRHTLAWRDLLPVLSFLFLKGKCRHCHKKISFRYPLVEFLTGFSFLFLFWTNVPASLTDWFVFLIWSGAIAILLVLLFIDLEHFIIPDKILAALGLLAVIQIVQGGTLYYSVLAGFFAGLFFFIIYLATKGAALGLGDVKLIFILGFLFGFPGILIIIYGSLIAGTLWGIVLILFFGAKLKSKISFGTVLSGTAIFYILFNKFFIPYLEPYILRLYL